MKHVATFLVRLAASFAGGSLLLSMASPAAQAFSFVPSSEGEVNVGLGSSLDSKGYLNTLGVSVESLAFEVSRGGKTFTTQSRLFVDRAGTQNTYGSNINFKSTDIGTSEASNSYWFRPVAMILDGNGVPIEAGQLETGKFRFTFDTPLESIALDFFDVESKGTSILAVNGQAFSAPLASKGNNSIQTVTLNNVTSFEVMIGNGNTSGPNRNDRGWGTGDGVLLRGEAEAAAVPEPMTIGGLMLAGAGLGLVRRKRGASAK